MPTRRTMGSGFALLTPPQFAAYLVAALDIVSQADPVITINWSGSVPLSTRKSYEESAIWGSQSRKRLGSTKTTGAEPKQ